MAVSDKPSAYGRVGVVVCVGGLVRRVRGRVRCG